MWQIPIEKKPQNYYIAPALELHPSNIALTLNMENNHAFEIFLKTPAASLKYIFFSLLLL